MDFAALIRSAVQMGASDLHLQVGDNPMLRLGGAIRTVQGNPITQEQMQKLLEELAPGHKNGVFDSAAQGWDFAYAMPDVARFRCSAYATMGRIGLVMRVI